MLNGLADLYKKTLHCPPFLILFNRNLNYVFGDFFLDKRFTVRAENRSTELTTKSSAPT